MEPTTSADAVTPLASGEGVVFIILSAFIVGMALFCMTRRNPVTAVMSLVASFVGLSALYATLSAHFLSILQVLVYAGAIMVLFIFVVMILNREETEIVALRGIATRVLALGAASTFSWSSSAQPRRWERRRRFRPSARPLGR